MNTIDRVRMARRKAKSLGLTLHQRGNVFTLRDDTGHLLMTGGITAVETHVGQRYLAARPGPQAVPIPAAWKPALDGYCLHLAAAGQSAGTIRLRRRLTIAHIARAVNTTPAALTAEQLVASFGQQPIGAKKPGATIGRRSAASTSGASKAGASRSIRRRSCPHRAHCHQPRNPRRTMLGRQRSRWQTPE